MSEGTSLAEVDKRDTSQGYLDVAKVNDWFGLRPYLEQLQAPELMLDQNLVIQPDID